VSGYPTNILVGRDGRIRARSLRFYDDDAGAEPVGLIESTLAAPL